MKLQYYSIYDVKAAYYMRPFLMQNDKTAMRGLAVSILNQQELCDYPEDYRLMNIGSFDESNGDIQPIKDDKGQQIAPQLVSEILPIYEAAKKAKQVPNRSITPEESAALRAKRESQFDKDL